MATGDDPRNKDRLRQLDLPLRRLRVIKGEGQRQERPLKSRDDVARVLVGAACDMMLRRISVERAHEIEVRVERINRLFDRLGDDPTAMALLRRALDELEQIVREGSEKQRSRR